MSARPSPMIPSDSDRDTDLNTALEAAPIDILLVDDDSKNLTVLETVLANPAYRLVRAESADQALLALIDREFALLILDIQMPGMNGFELAQMIKKRKKTAHVPIIFLTAYYNEDAHVLEGYDTGAVDYLYKPVNAAALRSKVAVFAALYRKSRECVISNAVLTEEVARRRRVEEQLRDVNQSLEERVAWRTQELREHATRLRRANEALEQFAYATSHDLQEPLRNVAIYSELLGTRYGAGLNQEASMYLQTIMDSARHMTDLVSGLLEYARVDDLGDSPAVSDAEEVFGRVLRNLRRTIEEGRATIVHDQLPSVPMKALHLEVVLQNLISNALKYKKNDLPPRVHVSAIEQAGNWCFSVTDNGIGIEPVYHAHVFRVFKRLHGSDGRYPGAGMGLAICQRIVERYSGQIWVESALGQGATFHFTIPKLRASS